MEVAGQRAHVGELAVGLYGVVSATAVALPAGINVDIAVTAGSKAGVDEAVRRRAYFVVGHPATPGIPTVPSHGWGQRQPRADDDAEFLFRPSVPVLRPHQHPALAVLRGRTRDVPARGIHTQSVGQSLRSEAHRTFPRCGHGIEERLVGRGSIDVRAMDSRDAFIPGLNSRHMNLILHSYVLLLHNGNGTFSGYV